MPPIPPIGKSNPGKIARTQKALVPILVVAALLLVKPLGSQTQAAGPNANQSTQSPTNEVEKIEQVSHIPYPPHLVLSIRKQDQKPFLSAVIPLIFEKKADGSWQLMATPEANHWQQTLMHDPLGGCPVVENALGEDVAYKPKLEFFFRHTRKLASQKIVIQAGIERQEAWLKDGCIDFANSCTRFSTFHGLSALTLLGEGFQTISLPLASEFLPFILVRYSKGDILPVPARLDTLVYDHDLQRLFLTYRATVLMGDPIRKIEYRLVGPDGWVKEKEQESKAQALTRHRAMRAYLEKCPLPPPGWSGEPCGDPRRQINFSSLSQALGLQRVLGRAAGKPPSEDGGEDRGSGNL